MDTLTYFETETGPICLDLRNNRVMVVATQTRGLEKPTPICEAFPHLEVEAIILSLIRHLNDLCRLRQDLRELAETEDD